MRSSIVLFMSLVAIANGYTHHLAPDATEFAELERSNLRAERVIAAKDKTIQKLMGRLQAAHQAVDPKGPDPYGGFSDGHHTPSLRAAQGCFDAPKERLSL